MKSNFGKRRSRSLTEINAALDAAGGAQATADAARAFAMISGGTPLSARVEAAAPHTPAAGGRTSDGGASPPGTGAALLPADAPGPAATPLRALTEGRRELAIAHAGETYVLRITRANKLILTKQRNDKKTEAGSGD